MTACFKFLWIPGLLMGALSAPTAQAAVIDLFTGEPQSIQRTMGIEAPHGSRYLLGGGLFEYRSLRLGDGEVNQNLLVENGTLSYNVGTTITNPQGNNRGYFNIEYLSVNSVDLLGDGATAFRVKFDFYSSSELRLLRFFVKGASPAGSAPIDDSFFHFGSIAP